MSLNFTLVYGSYREGRLGIRLVHHLKRALEAKGHQVTFTDAMAENLPLFANRYDKANPNAISPNLKRIADTIDATDAFIFVTGEYNHSLQPGLKNLMDYFYMEYAQKVAGIACYSAGGYAGVRAAVHMRAVLGELRMVSVPTLFPVGPIQNLLDEDGTTTSDSVIKNRDTFISELEWYGAALKAARG